MVFFPYCSTRIRFDILLYMRTRLSTDKVQLFSYFIGVCFIGSILLSMPFSYKNGHGVPYIDALFTAVSAVCVTGLSTLSMDVYSTVGFVVIMSLIELGGLGIISFIGLYLAVPKRKVSLVNRTVIRDFFIADVETEPRRILKSIIAYTLGIETIGAIILFLGFRASGSSRPAFDAAFHSISAFCNAGFSTNATSLEGFLGNRVLVVTVMSLIVLGGIGFIVLRDVLSRTGGRSGRRISFHSRLVLSVTGLLITFGALFFFIAEANESMRGLGIVDRVFASFFQSITPRTAGFDVLPQSTLAPVSKFVTMILMFIGGSPGSIAGGVKTTTFVIVIIYALRGNTERTGLNIWRRNLDTAVVEKAFSIVAKSVILVALALLALLVTERSLLEAGRATFLDLSFEVFSAFGTVGLSQGITGSLSTAGKAVIILTMFIGRTGIFAMALGFTRSEQERFFEYPSANVMVG